MQYRYFLLRNSAWHTLLDAGIKELEVDLNKIISHFNLDLKYFSNYPKLIEKYQRKTDKPFDAITGYYNDQLTIFINDSLTMPLQRWRIAHEIGHYVLKHNRYTNIDFEKEAQSFAARILMPIGVLNALNVSTAKEIQQFCNVTIESASFRMERLEQLRKRNVFETSELERKLILQFSDFIEKNKLN